ncbi:AarF/ABC1/UbiB kinase family protein [Phormidium yuhuli AB48]|uniref:AarF/ABC1/UbiB kinase family protein n=1 Tax=Phormidium yuhuli AB48 TaxID=2940671 RepID=A0ABY5ANR1_9CYAN|nr:AarF/ABC1/UbiB kinase family protein [Phormidium yuhuli]USR90411.1 AarF/ABC1/UbiB kinase family protein [Phormidium yuhuli AB48]
MLVKASPKPLRWQRTRTSLFARQVEIFAATGKLLWFLGCDRLRGKRDSKHRQQRAQWLVNTLLDLGPTFIKIGQALSTRGDLLPLEYIRALSQLQDKVPPFSSDEAIALIERELKNSLHSLYRDFDYHPIAAASLGQVHKARLHSGEEVVVKVQRPGLEKLFNLDFQVLYQQVVLAERLFHWTRKYDLESIYNEFRTYIYEEIDYIHEGKNAERFRENFSDSEDILVPKVYWRYTTSKVLTLEYMPGIKINDKKTLESLGIDVRELNTMGIGCYLKQLLIDGFFHTDPHPGNMAVTPEGQIIFYDFGMMSEINSLNQAEMTRSFFAVLRKDTDEVLETLISMGLVEELSDMTPVRNLVQFALDRFRDRPIEFQEFGALKQELYTMFEQQPFRLPAQMTFVLKALGTLDGIARTLDNQYSLIGCAKPFVKTLVVENQSGRGQVFGELTRQAKGFLNQRFNRPSRAEVLIQELQGRLERGEFQFRTNSPEIERQMQRIQLMLTVLVYACITGFSVLSGAVFISGTYPIAAFIAFSISGLSGLFFLKALLIFIIRDRF